MRPSCSRERIPPNRLGTQTVQASAGLATKVVHDPEVAPNRHGRVLAPHELVAQPLKQFGHRMHLLRPTLSCYELLGCPSAAAPAASLCAGHVQQLGGASPPANLMEVKA